jgi:uncharacterized surface protein with fasciclin (FAS1) repeats
VRKTTRLAAAAAAVLALSLAACSNEAPATEAPAAEPTAAAPTTEQMMSSSDGVTTDDDVFGPACDQLPQGDDPGSLDDMGPQPVASAASTNPLLTTLVAAVGNVPGLADTLNSAEALTVYAPADPAFEAAREALGEEAFTALLNDPDALGELLSYHVVGERMDAEALVEAGETTQLAGGTVTVGGTADAPTLTGGDGTTATVLCGNIPTANATVFVIDAVLQPAS